MNRFFFSALIGIASLLAAPALAAPAFPAAVHNMTVPGNQPSRIDAQASGAVSYEPSAPDHGVIVRTQVAYQFVYLPEPGYAGAATFTVTARGADGAAAVQAKRITVVDRGAPLYPANIVGSGFLGPPATAEHPLVSKLRALGIDPERFAAALK